MTRAQFGFTAGFAAAVVWATLGFLVMLGVLVAAFVGWAVVGVFIAAQAGFGGNVTPVLLVLPALWIVALWLAGAYDVRSLGAGPDAYRTVLNAGLSLTAAVAIFSFQTTWNDFLGPLVFLQKADVKTIILGLYGLMGMQAEWQLVMAAVVAAVLPLIVVFFAFQKYFVQGITVSGLKG